MDSDFLKYLKEGRADFADAAAKYDVANHKELRTAIDDFVIAYDQAVDTIKTTAFAKADPIDPYKYSNDRLLEIVHNPNTKKFIEAFSKELNGITVQNGR